MADDDRREEQDGGRRSDPLRDGGPSKRGRLRPDIDAKDPEGEKDGRTAQNTPQSSGLGSGQS